MESEKVSVGFNLLQSLFPSPPLSPSFLPTPSLFEGVLVNFLIFYFYLNFYVVYFNHILYPPPTYSTSSLTLYSPKFIFILLKKSHKIGTTTPAPPKNQNRQMKEREKSTKQNKKEKENASKTSEVCFVLANYFWGWGLPGSVADIPTTAALEKTDSLLFQ